MTRTLPRWRPLSRCAFDGCDMYAAYDRTDGRCYWHGKLADGNGCPWEDGLHHNNPAPAPRACRKQAFPTMAAALEHIASRPESYGALHTYKCSWHHGPTWHVTNKHRSKVVAA